MTIDQFLLMKNEILLIAIAVIVLIIDLMTDNKKILFPVMIILFIFTTVIGFIYQTDGELFGGMYRSTPLINMMKNILNTGVLIILLQSAGWLINKAENHENIGGFCFILISSLAGMCFMISSGDFLMFYLGLELATIPIAALVAYEKMKFLSAEAGTKFILSAVLSSGILLYGISILYGTNGSILFKDLNNSVEITNLQALAFIFILSGIAFKISLVPFHLWTADVYEGAPVNITSFLSSISKAASVFILLILLFTVFINFSEIWNELLVYLSILTMTIGNLFAIRQQNLKRFLAFSSIAQAGFIPLGFIGGTSLGASTVLYFLLIYVFSNLGAFGVVSVVTSATGKESMNDYNGFYKTNRGLSIVMMLSLFSLAGIPPVAGFFSKFFLFTIAAKQGYYFLLFIAVINATISLYYYLLVVKAMFINENEQPIEKITSDVYAKLGLAICVLGIVFTGLFGIIFDYINTLSKGI
ncbi:MAG: NADH-quinone oxidoreductase subunit N [Ignavibacteria bacterium]|nr:NADH-quinone oxidoreductase subunit N [Ignavibacteria bacterium]